MQRGNALEEQAARQQRPTEPVAVPAVAPREKRRVPARPESRLRPPALAMCWFEIPIRWPLAWPPRLWVLFIGPSKRAAGCMPGRHTLNYGAFREGLQTAREEKNKSFQRSGTLRRDDVFHLGFDLHSRKAGGIPASAERLDQQHAGNQPLPLDHRELLLIGEQILLRSDHVQVADQATAITARRNGQRAPRGIHCELLRSLGLDQHAQSGDFVLYLLKSAKHRLAVTGDVRVIAGARKLHLSTARPSGEYILPHVRADRPNRAPYVGRFGEVAGLPAALSEKIQRRIIRGSCHANLRVGHRHFALRLRNVRAALEQI